MGIRFALEACQLPTRPSPDRKTAQEPIATLLIKAGAPINAQNNNDRTPLSQAVTRGGLPVMRILVKNGADVNLPDQQGFTPLHVAAAFAGPGEVRLLLKNGADPKARTKSGKSAMDFARDRSREMVEPLLEHPE